MRGSRACPGRRRWCAACRARTCPRGPRRGTARAARLGRRSGRHVASPRLKRAPRANLAAIETLELHASGLTFDALADGAPDGRVVLLLHGFPQTSREWRGVMPALAAAGCRVIAPDLRGYSPRARTGPYDVRTLVGDVLAFTDAPQFDLVGHDWGAAIAWQTAIRHPERVRTLTTISVPHPLAFTQALPTDADQQERSAYMRRFA